MAGYKVHSFDKIPSTQDTAHQMILDGRADDRTAIVAQAQSAGRGRYRRKWVSHHGNLYVSFIYSAPERDSRLAYVVAVAVSETLNSYGIDCEIKWPNDILVCGKKISGILIEYSGPYVIVGIGINIKSNPTVDAYKTTKIEQYISIPPTPTDVLARLMRNLDKWQSADFLTVRQYWLDHVVGLNGTVSYQGQPAILVGMNENGGLILRRQSRYLMVYGDEISM